MEIFAEKIPQSIIAFSTILVEPSPFLDGYLYSPNNSKNLNGKKIW